MPYGPGGWTTDPVVQPLPPGKRSLGQMIVGAVGGVADDSQSAIDQRRNLEAQGRSASDFAGQGEYGFGMLGGEAQREREYLRRLASGEDSVSAEQLRQGLQQNLSGQRSLAAGASPQNSVMAARTAAMQSARLGSGFAGQQAVAGLQERQLAHRQLTDAIIQQRQQELQAALGSRQNAISGYGGYKPEGSTLDKWGNAIAGGAAIATKSDRRAKEDIEDGDDEADRAIAGLRAYKYRYKSSKDGKGGQLGVMAQSLERVGLKQAVIDTPDGKYLDTGKLTGANTALIARLGARLSKLEGKGK